MQDQIVKALEEALKGKKQVKVTFKKEAIPDLQYLSGMIGGGYVSLSADDQKILGIVRFTNDWGRDHNRTMVITLTDHFDQDFFVGRMSRRNVLEKIEAIK